MSVAKVIEISSTSTDSFDTAVKDGVKRASQSVRNITSAWVKDMRVTVKDGGISEYQVNMQVTFLLDDKADAS
jgi:flavin-binding protein dodecin